ncbi:MAG TPA: hypothetical protein VKA97_14455, partial [Pyrinomonadaceae bacterium]|nr:hypothetical protein [Pyrinomonadaceae bacterium]
RISLFVARLFFRGIYFPQMGWRAWLKVIAQNHRTILQLTRDSIKGARRIEFTRDLPDSDVGPGDVAPVVEQS